MVTKLDSLCSSSCVTITGSGTFSDAMTSICVGTISASPLNWVRLPVTLSTSPSFTVYPKSLSNEKTVMPIFSILSCRTKVCPPGLKLGPIAIPSNVAASPSLRMTPSELVALASVMVSVD